MKGSEKQVEWAEGIRAKALPIIDIAQDIVREQAQEVGADPTDILTSLRSIRGSEDAGLWIGARDILTGHGSGACGASVLRAHDVAQAEVVAGALEMAAVKLRIHP